MPGGAGSRWQGWAKSSGSQIFDGYRAGKLRGLEEEQCGFQAYLERSRRAQDKVEFDEFMAVRRKQLGMAQPAALQQGNPPVIA